MSDVQSRIHNLVAWATGHGAVLHPSVQVYHDASTGLSLRVLPSATAPLPPWEPIVSLPTCLSLSYLNAKDQDRLKRFPDALLKKLPPHVIGRLVLAREYLAGPDSFWAPYIQALPQPQDAQAWALPPFWPRHEADLLEGTNVDKGIDKIRHDVAADILLVRDVLLPFESSTASCPPWLRRLADALAASPTLYHWAYCIFSSRSFRPSLVLPHAQGDDFSVLLPLFDIGNHDMTTEVRWELDDAGRNCELRVGRSHAPGHQIYNNYSLKTNAELLLGYGFMLPTTDELHNDYTHVSKRSKTAPVASDQYLISLRPLSHPSSMMARCRAKASAANHGMSPHHVLGAFSHVEPNMVWDIFCTLTACEQRGRLIAAGGRQGSEAQDWRRAQFLSGRVESDAREYLVQTITLIQHKVLQELDRLDETHDDVSLDTRLTPNARLALDYQQRCRSVLTNTLEAIARDGILPEDDGDDEHGEHSDPLAD